VAESHFRRPAAPALYVGLFPGVRERLGERLGVFPEANCHGLSDAGGMSEYAVVGVRGVSAVYATFRDAVLDLSEEPTKANIARYLNASRALDEEPSRDPPAERPSGNRKSSSK
jgi:hypothetical protein